MFTVGQIIEHTGNGRYYRVTRICGPNYLMAVRVTVTRDDVVSEFLGARPGRLKRAVIRPYAPRAVAPAPVQYSPDAFELTEREAARLGTIGEAWRMDDVLNAVADRINRDGWRTTVEHPGYLLIWHSNGDDTAAVGCANGYWSGEWSDRDGVVGRTFELATKISGMSNDVDAIASAILDRLRTIDDPPSCPFCSSQSHTDVRNCPEIDPEQLIEELRRTERLFCGDVAEYLRAFCNEPGAYAEHSGGGIWCVYIPEPAIPDTEWQFGMADTNWGGGLKTIEFGEVYGEPGGEQILTTDVSSYARYERQAAEAIAASINSWRQERRYAERFNGKAVR